MPPRLRISNHPPPVAGLLVLGLGFGLGCATSSAQTRDGTEDGERPVVKMDPMHIQRDVDPLLGLDVYDPSDVLARANQYFDAGDYDRAVKVFGFLVETFPGTELVPTALYNAGLAYERLAEYESALASFRRVISEHEDSAHLKDAYFRCSLNLAKLERWSDVADNYWTIRQLSGLTTIDELEARVGLAIAMFMQNDYLTAEREFMASLRFYDERQKVEYIPADYWVAQSRFYLGEIAAREFESVKLEGTTNNPEAWMTEVSGRLEAKCQHLIRAQNHLIRAIRAGHTGWASAAGFRIGSLYEVLYEEMMVVPTPPDLPEGAKELYIAELREKLSVLVSKAMMVYERSLEMAERVGEKNEWVERTERALERMKTLALANLKG